MIICVASGKGGTGKTMVAVNLAWSIGKDVRLLDCDVEGPNAHLFVKPVFEKTHTATVPFPAVDESKCNLCGKCAEICQFKAIVPIGGTVMVFDEMCHGCGGCMRVCPERAITEKTREIGSVQQGNRNGIEFVRGKLRIGEAMSPPLIRKVREFADLGKTNIIDAPPGTSCPVITAMKGTDFVVLVTEPTPFGLYDLELAAEAVKILGIPCGIVINRSDIGDDRAIKFAEKENLPILMEIPFKREFAEACSRGEMIAEIFPEWKEKFVELYQTISQRIGQTGVQGPLAGETT